MLVLVRPAAAADVEEAAHWYERQRKGLGEEFVAVVDVAVQAIAAYPFRQPVLFREVRRHLLRRFPYGLFYRVYPNVIVVVACMHGRRSPSHWRRRA